MHLHCSNRIIMLAPFYLPIVLYLGISNNKQMLHDILKGDINNIHCRLIIAMIGIVTFNPICGRKKFLSIFLFERCFVVEGVAIATCLERTTSRSRREGFWICAGIISNRSITELSVSSVILGKMRHSQLGSFMTSSIDKLFRLE